LAEEIAGTATEGEFEAGAGRVWASLRVVRSSKSIAARAAVRVRLHINQGFAITCFLSGRE
jgi:hypothetical protein